MRFTFLTKPLVLVLLTAVAILALAGAGIWWLSRPPVPAAILKQVEFTMFYPKTGGPVSVKPETYKYDAKLKQFSFVATVEGKTVSFSEQASPEQFTDIPDYFPKLMDRMGQYASFENAAGKVVLTRPPGGKNQVAVMNAKGTLLFAQAGSNLTTSQWRQLMNSLQTRSGT